MTLTFADVVFLINVLVWSMSLGVYALSFLVIRKHQDKYDRYRNISGGLVLVYVCYSYVEVFAGNQQDVDPRHIIGIVIGCIQLVTSILNIPKSLDSRTDRTH